MIILYATNAVLVLKLKFNTMEISDLRDVVEQLAEVNRLSIARKVKSIKEVAEANNRKCSEVLRELIKEYIMEKDISK